MKFKIFFSFSIPTTVRDEGFNTKISEINVIVSTGLTQLKRALICKLTISITISNSKINYTVVVCVSNPFKLSLVLYKKKKLNTLKQ